MGSVLLIIATFLLYVSYTLFIYPFFFCPLRKIPRAHWSVPFPVFGSIWISVKRYRFQSIATTYNAHCELGPVVRLGNNEISVNCYDGGLRTVYTGGWEKHEFYPRLFLNLGAMNMVSTIGHKAHAQKKRILSNIYSKSYIQNSAQIEHNNRELLFNRCFPLIESLALSKQPCDVVELSAAVGMDFMTAYLFGISRATNFIEDVDLRQKYLHAYTLRRPWQSVITEIHPLVESFLNRFGSSLFPISVHEATSLLDGTLLKMCESAESHLKQLYNEESEKKGLVSNDHPIVYKQYKEGLLTLREQDPTAGREDHSYLTTDAQSIPEKEADPYTTVENTRTMLEVYSEMGDHMFAGHDTTSVTMTYLFHELCKHPQVQDRLAAEVCTLSRPIKWPSERRDLPTPKEIDSLPYLNAVIMEILRLRSPAPGSLARVSPPVPGGSSLGPPNTSHHYTGIPAGVRVSAMSYAIHRIPGVFPDPETFRPDRWLTTDQGGHTTQEQMIEMNHHFWAFGSGGRMCIGSHFALQEIKLLVSAIYGNYKTEIGDDEGIEQADAFLTYPKSGKFVLRFIKR